MGRTESAAWPTCRLREERGRDGLNYLEKEGRGWLNPHLFPSSGPRGAPRPSRVKIGRASSVSGGYFQTSKATTGRYTAGGERPDLQNLDSLQVLFADAHRNHLLARRAQGLSERQRAMNRSVLRLLAYPKPDCRQRPTTWKKNGRRGPREGARSKQ